MRCWAALLATGSAWAACLAPSGPRILARDLAAAFPEFASAPADAAIAYAPLAGVRRVMNEAEVRRAAHRLGVSLDRAVEVCFEWPLAPLAAGRIVEALRRAAGDAAADVVIAERMNAPAPAGPLAFTAPAAPTGGAVLWRGAIDYGSDQLFRVWVRARVRVRRPRVVAAAPLEARRRIEAGQVRLVETLVDFPEKGAAGAVAEVVGKAPRSNIAAGATVPLAALDTPQDVARGDVVKLLSGDAVARITTEATAVGAGRRGDTILVRNNSSGRLVRARIEERGLVKLAAGGGSE
jgi:flagella basal body P-ring formation protein FlgA